MSNKDFRNMKQTQFDPGQVLKGSFSEQSSALRTTGVNGILKDTYTDIVQTVDDKGRPLTVEYYQANIPSQDTILFSADVSGNKAGTYYSFTNPTDKKVYVIYQVVSGIGTAPQVGDVELAVEYDNNDPASIVTLANLQVLRNIEDIKIVSKNILNSNIVIEYDQFGDAAAIDVGSTGFAVSRSQEGDSRLVGEVTLSYDTDGSVIYNGNRFAGLVYNIPNATFDVDSSLASLPESLIFDQNTATVMYLGTAEYGSLPSEAKWKIQKIDTSSGVVITNASTKSDQIWDNREALTYV